MTAEQQTLAMTHIESSAPGNGDSPVPAAVPTALAPADSSSGGTAESAHPATEPGKVREIGGRKDGPEPTRFGDWERNGRCVDF